MTNTTVTSLLAELDLGSELVWPTRFLVVDDAASTRRFLRTVLECSPRFEVAGEASTSAAAVTLAGALQPDVVLLDIAMPVTDGVAALPDILRIAPNALVVFLSGTDPQRAPSLLAAGATAFIPKGLPPFELLERLGQILEQRPSTGSAPMDDPPFSGLPDPEAVPPQAVVCDDDPMTRKLVGQVMKSCGLAVLADTETVPNLLTVVQLAQPELVVLDLWLEGRSGTSAIPEILSVSPNTRIIAYSAHDAWAGAAIAAGATAFVAKPRFEELAAQTEQLMWLTPR
jgi:DNA-binding NarL/FixJ family response regulator